MSAEAKNKSSISFPYLRRFNGIMSGAHLLQAVLMLVGVYDLASLIMVFALNATMNLMGLMMEVHNQDAPRTRWTSFMIGCFSGAVPWAVVLQYRKIGKWADYRNGEHGYILLSLVARACWRGLFSSGPSSPRSASLP